MTQSREIKIVIASTHNTRPSSRSNHRRMTWPGCLMLPVKSWTTSLFGNKDVPRQPDEGFEPLLEERRGFAVRRAASSLLRMTAPRPPRKLYSAL